VRQAAKWYLPMCNNNPTESCSATLTAPPREMGTSFQPLNKPTVYQYLLAHRQFMDKMNWITEAIGVLLAITEKTMFHVN
jgi:hypothetical protein